jgi:hypothetical protein
VNVETYDTALTSKNALDIFKGYDVVVDGTDNFPTRYLVNDACVLLGIPNAYGSIFRFEGQASVFGTKEGPCYRCLYPEPPPPGLVPSCAEGGVLGVLPASIGCIQANETSSCMLGIGEPLIGRFLVFDALRMKFRELKLRKDPDCPVCGTHPTVKALIDYEQFCGCRGAARDGGQPRADRQPGDQRPRAEGEDGSRRGRVRAGRPRAARVRDQPDPRLGPDPAGRSAAAVHGARRQPRDHLPVQVGSSQRARGRVPARPRVQERRRTSRAACSPGSTRSIRASRNTEDGTVPSDQLGLFPRIRVVGTRDFTPFCRPLLRSFTVP